MAPKKDPAGAARFEEEQELPEDLDLARLMVNMMREQRQERHFFQQQLLQLQQQIIDN